MDMFCQRTVSLPSGKLLCESFVIRHPGVCCTFRSKAQRKLLPARVQAAAPGGGESNGEKRRRKPWRKKSKDTGAGKDKVTFLPGRLGVEHPPSRKYTDKDRSVFLKLGLCILPAESSSCIHKRATAEAKGGREHEERGTPKRRTGSRRRGRSRWLVC